MSDLHSSLNADDSKFREGLERARRAVIRWTGNAPPIAQQQQPKIRFYPEDLIEVTFTGRTSD